MLLKKIPEFGPDLHVVEETGNESHVASPDYFFILENKSFVKIPFETIRFVNSNCNYLTIKTTYGSHLAIGSLLQLEKILPSHLFCRVHRSWIVPWKGISVIAADELQVFGEWIPLAPPYRRKIVSAIKPYIFNRAIMREVQNAD